MSWKKSVLNFFIYLILLIGFWYLYSPLNMDSQNNPKSNIQFVYAKF
jgi:hypothetical protein